MREFVAAASVLTMLAASSGDASACSPPAGDPVIWAQQREAEYLEHVTSIYLGVAEDVVGDVDSGVTFMVRASSNVWGDPALASLHLSHEPGACSNALVLWLEDFTGQPFADGVAVRVFVAPEAAADPTLLYVVPEGPIAEGMMTRWRALRAEADEQRP